MCKNFWIPAFLASSKTRQGMNWYQRLWSWATLLGWEQCSGGSSGHICHVLTQQWLRKCYVPSMMKFLLAWLCTMRRKFFMTWLCTMHCRGGMTFLIKRTCAQWWFLFKESSMIEVFLIRTWNHETGRRRSSSKTMATVGGTIFYVWWSAVTTL